MSGVQQIVRGHHNGKKKEVCGVTYSTYRINSSFNRYLLSLPEIGTQNITLCISFQND